MKRASLMMLALTGVILASGCRTAKEYDDLYASWETCNKAGVEMRQTLATTETKLKATEQERDRLLQEKTALESNWRTQYDKLQAAFDELAKNPGGITINAPAGGPLPPALNKALEDLAKKYNLEYDPARGAVRFSSDLIFDLGSHSLKPEVGKQLADFAKIINMPEAAKFDVLVVGHTDGVPVSRPETKAHTPTNWHLSVYRAVSVVEALRDDQIAPGRLGAMGFGQERPRPGTSNAVTKPPGTKENRRVEVFLVPHQSLSGATGQAPLGSSGQDIAAVLGN